ncbi:MAG: hypothetical protein V8Q84_00820 [Bilophila sp.]
MAATYGIAYLVAVAWTLYAPHSIAGLGFGMLFFWGMLAAMGVRKFMHFRRINTLVDNETSRRITSMAVDFMICAVFMGIRFNTLQDILGSLRAVGPCRYAADSRPVPVVRAAFSGVRF